MAKISYRCHRFPAQVIQHAVWLYLRFSLSYRDVEDLLAERGVDVSYETVRRWVLKFGPLIARRLRRAHPKPSRHWHLDEMVVRIAGKTVYLWRAVDHEGEVLDVLVQRRRDKRAAVKLMRKLLKRQGVAPAVVVTDKLLVRGGIRGARPRGTPRAGPAKEQPRRSLAPTGAPSRAQDAAVQITGIGSALPLPPCRRPQYVQSPAPPALPSHAAPLPCRGDGAVAGSNGGRLISMPRPAHCVFPQFP